MLLQAIENLLNRGLPASPRARALASELTGKPLVVDVVGVARIRVECRGEALALAHERDPSPAAAEVRGRPLALLGLAGADAQTLIQRGEVVVAGDAETAEKFRELALLLRPDLEEELSRFVGDAAAHRMARFAAGAFEWSRRTADTTVRNVAEYLAHEQRDLVPRAEADQFLKGVDALREAADRLESRIAYLERRE